MNNRCSINGQVTPTHIHTTLRGKCLLKIRSSQTSTSPWMFTNPIKHVTRIIHPLIQCVKVTKSTVNILESTSTILVLFRVEYLIIMCFHHFRVDGENIPHYPSSVGSYFLSCQNTIHLSSLYVSAHFLYHTVFHSFIH